METLLYGESYRDEPTWKHDFAPVLELGHISFAIRFPNTDPPGVDSPTLEDQQRWTLRESALQDWPASAGT